MTQSSTGVTRRERRNSVGHVSPKFHGLPLKQSSALRPNSSDALSQAPALRFLIPDGFLKPGITEPYILTVVVRTDEPVSSLAARIVKQGQDRIGLWSFREEDSVVVMKFVCHQGNELEQVFRTVNNSGPNKFKLCFGAVKADRIPIQDVRMKMGKA